MSHRTPSSSAPSTVSKSASSPAACPSVRLRPCRVAQRPFPSITQATWAGMRSGSRSEGSTAPNLVTRGTVPPWSTSARWRTSAFGLARPRAVGATSASAPSAADRCRRRSRWRRSCRCSRCSSCVIAVVGFLSVGRRRLHQRRHRRTSACTGGAAEVVDDAIATAEASRRTASIIGLVGLLWAGPRRSSARCRPPATPRGRHRAGARRPGRGRSRWLRRRRHAVPRSRAALGPGARAGCRAASWSSTVGAGIALTTVLFVWTYTFLGNQSVAVAGPPPRRRAGRGRLRDPQADRPVYVPRARRRARRRSTAPSAWCSPRSRGSRSTPGSSSTARCSTSCAGRPQRHRHRRDRGPPHRRRGPAHRQPRGSRRAAPRSVNAIRPHGGRIRSQNRKFLSRPCVEPVSSSDLRSLRTQAWPPPPPSPGPRRPGDECAPVIGAPVELVDDGQRAEAVVELLDLVGERRVKRSAAVVGSISIRHVVTSRWGGSASRTSPSMRTSGHG